ncbi:hypothetical protein DVH24_007883 [Malus domestica]|uniref:Uncharacterized protein n=1 Tax=Malus domestica TaxID=3750 RepID=A0A498JRJ8_MALDO|nr:hypothetical protein DVH24_007883 [Malus domestica]
MEEMATLKGQLVAQEAAREAEIAAQLSAQDDKMNMIFRALQMSGLQIPMPAPDLAPLSTSQPLRPIDTQ